MRTEYKRMIAVIPRKIILNGINILIQAVSHRRAFVPQIYNAVIWSHIRYRNHREWLSWFTLVAHPNIRGAGLVAQRRRQPTL